MTGFAREELESAFARLTEATDRGFLTGDLDAWLDCFAEDVSYRDLGYGFENGWKVELRGREAVRDWSRSAFSAYPFDAMLHWPVPWHIVDPDRGWVVCERRARMRDPGNGEVFEEKRYTRLAYAGDGRWSFVEDIYNPVRTNTMLSLWIHTRRRCEAEGVALPDVSATDPAVLHAEVRETDGSDEWSRAEIEAAVKRFEDVGNRAFTGDDHDAWLQSYTDDVYHHEIGFGYGWECEELHGRDSVRRWIDAHCGVHPVNQMVHFPMPWVVIDERRGWVVLEYQNCMTDPGDGRDYRESSYARLKYAGSDQWRFEEDVYSPLRMRAMLDRWLDAWHRCGGVV